MGPHLRLWTRDARLPAPLNGLRLAGWEPEWDICKNIEQVSVHIHSSFITSIIHLFMYEMTSNLSRKGKVVLHSTQEKPYKLLEN